MLVTLTYQFYSIQLMNEITIDYYTKVEYSGGYVYHLFYFFLLDSNGYSIQLML